MPVPGGRGGQGRGGGSSREVVPHCTLQWMDRIHTCVCDDQIKSTYQCNLGRGYSLWGWPVPGSDVVGVMNSQIA